MVDFVIKDSYPYIEGLELINIFEEPYPSGVFQQSDNTYPYYPNHKKYKIFEEPYPLGIFLIKDSYPFLAGLKLIEEETETTPVIYMGDKPITNIYYGNKPIVAVFFGKQRIM